MARTKITEIEVNTDFLDEKDAELAIWLEENMRLIRALMQTFASANSVVLERTHIGNSIVETTLFSTVLPEYHMHDMHVMKLHINGFYDTGAAADTWTIRVKLGGTTLNAIARQSANNALSFGWDLQMMITTRSIGESGTVIDLATLIDDNTIKIHDDETIHAVDTTVDNLLEVTVQWGAAKVANDFHLDQGMLHHYP